jgi:acyl carrier protein
MTRDDIALRVKSTMCEMFELAAASVTPEADLRSDLGLDSIDAVDLAVRFQEITGRKVPLSELMGLKTVSDVVDLVARHVQQSD